jgi:hypothetical protein
MKCALMFPLWLCVTAAMAIGGCASLGDARISARQYRTLVVADFENAIGKALPTRVHQELPGAVIAHLNRCYSGAFDQILRAARGTADEVVIRGTVTDFQAGNRNLQYAGSIFGLGTAKFAVDVSFSDGQNGQPLGLAKGEWEYRYGGVKGSVWGMDDLVRSAGANVADLIAEKRGATRQEATGCAK